MIEDADSSTVRDARARYFAVNGFSEATYRDRWVKVRLGRVPFAFPNTASRRRAIPLHDLHHVATGYPTSVIGEAEIGAWELAGGCTDHGAAWLLDASAFAWGVVLAPRRVYRAFVRGRHARTLYADGWDDQLLELTVGELRHRLALDREPAPASWRDRAAFAGWVVVIALPAIGAAAFGWWLV
jgi:hypothetical protein